MKKLCNCKHNPEFISERINKRNIKYCDKCNLETVAAFPSDFNAIYSLCKDIDTSVFNFSPIKINETDCFICSVKDKYGYNYVLKILGDKQGYGILFYKVKDKAFKACSCWFNSAEKAVKDCYDDFNSKEKHEVY